MTMSHLRTSMTLACMLAAAALTACDESDPAATTTTTPTPGTTTVSAPLIENASLENQLVDVGCAYCTYEMDGADTCLLAAVVNGTPVLVEGAEMDHSLCSQAGKALVTGEVRDGTLVVSKLEMQ